MKPLQQLAEKTKAAFVLIQHPGKSNKAFAQQKVLGSTGITAICRAVWGVYADPDDANKRLFAPLKMNCGYNPTTVSYQIAAPQGKVQVLDTDLRMTGDDIEALIAAARREPRGRKPVTRNGAVEWLREKLALADKCVPVKEIMKEAKAKKFSQRTIERAKEELGIKPIKNRTGWFWCLKCGQ